MIAVECEALAHHVWKNKSAEPLLFAVQKCNLFSRPTRSLAEFKSTWREEFTALWKQKPLHGQFPSQIEAITTSACAYQWLRLSYLKLETEAMITAAQDQAIRTKAYNVNVLHSSNDSLCRWCHSSDETIFHVLSACPALAPTEYLERHNSVASLLHKHICEYYGIPTCKRPWLYKPQPVLTGEYVKILWDFTINTDRFVSENRPDIVVYDTFNRSVILLDVAVPADFNIVSKEHDKISGLEVGTAETVESYNNQNISYCDWGPGVPHF